MDDARLTKDRLATARVIAKGHRIRDVQRLVSEHGGQARNWSKRSTRPFEDDRAGWIELHWYEHHGIGRFEIKEVPVRI